ncbi:MAG: phage holin family protein [Anaerolineae bacterium]|nr:phage holin family protein [Anaerolineae bacterium]
MAYLLLRLLVNALSIAVIARFLPGIHVATNDLTAFILIGLVFGVINALLKPIITLLTCSLVVLTLGLFILVINGLMLWLTAALLPQLFQIDSFGWAILGGIIISIINMVLESVIGDRDGSSKVEVRVDR